MVPLPRLELGQAQGPTDFESVVSTNSTRAAIISISYMGFPTTLPSIKSTSIDTVSTRFTIPAIGAFIGNLSQVVNRVR
jgi:hypothetical protein